MRTRVFVAADVGSTLLTALERDSRFDLVYYPVRSTDELISMIGDSEVLVTRHHNRVSAAVFESARALRLVAQGTSGLDNIDTEQARLRNVMVASLPGENANAVAELVVAHMISLTRGVPDYNEMVRDGRWERDSCVQRRELRSHQLGIVGLGRVGSRVSHLAGLFGMAVLAYDPYLTDENFTERGAERTATLDELLSKIQILTLHVPLTEETQGMIGRSELARLGPGAYVINASRGKVIDQQALFEMLNQSLLGGAALDVFETEPPEGIEWPSRDRLILTPHIAGCSRESKESIGHGLYSTICSFLNIEPYGS